MILIGNITPTEDWLAMKMPISTEGILCRFYCVDKSLKLEDVWSSCLVRRVFELDKVRLPEATKYIRPFQGDRLVNFELPSKLISTASGVDLEVRKRYRLKPWKYTEPNWSVNIFAIV